LRMVICPEAIKAQNNIAAVSAEGSTVWVLICRLNSSCRRSIEFDVRIEFHWLFGNRVKVNSCSPLPPSFRRPPGISPAICRCTSYALPRSPASRWRRSYHCNQRRLPRAACRAPRAVALSVVEWGAAYPCASRSGGKSPHPVRGEAPEHDDTGCRHLCQQIRNACGMDEKRHKNIGEPEAHGGH
jgi:hypothetical protein